MNRDYMRELIGRDPGDAPEQPPTEPDPPAPWEMTPAEALRHLAAWADHVEHHGLRTVVNVHQDPEGWKGQWIGAAEFRAALSVVAALLEDYVDPPISNPEQIVVNPVPLVRISNDLLRACTVSVEALLAGPDAETAPESNDGGRPMTWPSPGPRPVNWRG